MKINNTTLSKIVIKALPAIGLGADNAPNCHTDKLLREIQAEQGKLPYSTQSQVMQKCIRKLSFRQSSAYSPLSALNSTQKK